MNFGRGRAFALLELRTLCRTVRVWMFLLLTVGTGATLFVAHAVNHHLYSGVSPTQGSVAPRFLVNNVGTLVLLVAMAGLVFLAYDIVDKDRRDRIAEVIGTRSATNLALLAGRLAGIVLAVWLVVICFFVAVQAVGLTVEAYGIAVAVAFEPLSFAAFVIVDSLPVLTLWGSLLTLLAVVCPSRLLAGALAFAFLVGYVVALFSVPVYFLPVLGVPGFTEFASDILPHFTDGPTLAQRVSMILLAGGLLCLAASFHDRLDWASRAGQCAVAVSLICISSFGFGSVAVHASQHVHERADWTAIHAEHRNDSRVDVKQISGKIVIDPGRGLRFDISLVVNVPASVRDRVVMSLNPGMSIEVLKLNGSIVPFHHDAGLLDIDVPEGTIGQAVIAMRASGIPDPHFGYLDGVVHGDERSLSDSQLHMLGSDTSIFTRDYVALMPGARWLPRAGADFASDDGGSAVDFFLVDLLVEVPKGWLVAGPGRRKQAGTEGSATHFSFRSSVPISEFALVASEFNRRAILVDSIEVELLLHPEHSHNFDALPDLNPNLFLEEILIGDPDARISYLLDGLSIVEAPGRLRAYGGGWRLDTTLASPGIILLRERGLPVAQLHRHLDDVDSEYIARRYISQYFANDLLGGDFAHMLRNQVLFHTHPEGASATALQFAVESLTDAVFSWSLSRPDSHTRFFSGHVFTAPHVGIPIASDLLARAMGNTAWISFAAPRETKRYSAWSLLTKQPQKDLNLGSNPREALAALTLRGRALGALVVDHIGPERTAAFLAELRRRHMGDRFGKSDFIAAAEATTPLLGPLFNDWLENESLPGFIASPPELYPLSDDDLGRSRYQVRVHVRNDESSSGYVRLYCDMPTYDRDFPGLTEPILIPGDSTMEIGMISRGRPRALSLLPYLSRNAGPVVIPIPNGDSENLAWDQPLAGFRPSSWEPMAKGIIVDDLDPGFVVRQHLSPRYPVWLSALTPSIPHDLDSGVPAFAATGFAHRGLWVRKEARSSWGKYRRTHVRATSGDGDNHAVFSTQLPHRGNWQLEYHIPGQVARGSITPRRDVGLGETRIVIQQGAFQQELTFDASEALLGWNTLGLFHLTSGDVDVVVSNDTGAEAVVADAIRWRP